ncbi:MAG: hypothetical protein AAGF23_08045 [Acidobacteriota bacterium]
MEDIGEFVSAFVPATILLCFPIGGLGLALGLIGDDLILAGLGGFTLLIGIAGALLIVSALLYLVGWLVKLPYRLVLLLLRKPVDWDWEQDHGERGFLVLELIPAAALVLQTAYWASS